ncbi:fimbrial protein [Andreprevotia chitinilytica]|uniref:fimbrial protein n=1 Tax=Andreprevotia chitinilytica TaxID=396808 RepID=UPI00068A6775|nr:fimbrial protein [Andreprevotia chitinilytica]
MKLTALSLLVVAGVCMHVAHAASADSGTIQFNGKVLDTTCTIDNNALTVDMGTVGADSFKTAGTTGPDKLFSIDLSGCNAALNGVKVQLTGNADGTVPDDLSVGTTASDAKGIAIALQDATHNKPVAINSTTDEFKLGETTAKLQFAAHYVSTAQAVTAGDANANAQFVLNYR